MPTRAANKTIVVSALQARTSLGKLLQQVEDEGRSLVIEKRGAPKAVLLSIRDYVRLATPAPEILRIVGQRAKQNGTSKLTSRQIDQLISDTRKQKRAR